MHLRVSAITLAALTCLAGVVAGPAAAQGIRKPTTGLTPRLSGATAPSPRVLAAPAASAPATAQRTEPETADYIVAVVNSEPITRHELDYRVERMRRQLATDGGRMPADDVLTREVLERFIFEKVQLQLAAQDNIKVDELAIDQAVATVAQQNSISNETMYRQLAADGITPEQFRGQLRTQLLMQRLRERAVASGVKVSESEIDDYLRKQQKGSASSAPSGGEINLANILIAVPEGASPEVVAEREKRAQEVAQQARSGEDFAALAKKYSDAPDAAQGGDMGMRPAERYPELFLNATAQLANGAISEPVRSGAGFHVLKVVAKSQASGSSIVQNHARHILLRTGPELTEAAAAARLAEYRQRIEAGLASFESLAREHSQDGSAAQGGDLGWASPGRYVPEFEQALDALKPGEISKPVVSRFGVHLIQLVERRKAKLSGREERDVAREAVRQKKLEDAYADWAREQRARAYVEYRDAPR